MTMADHLTAVALITAWSDGDPDGAGSWVTMTDCLRTVEDWERTAIALANVALEFADRAAAAEGVPSAEIVRGVATVAAWQDLDEQAS